MYLVDNNALAKLTMSQRASKFFRQRCRLPSEVIYEARGFPDFRDLETLEYHTTARVLKALTLVLATVSAGDTKLVNLYANQGNADPLLIACAIDGQWANEEALFGPLWVIVSDDKAVRNKSLEFGIGVRSSTEFSSLL